MLSVIIAIVVIIAAAWGIYLILKNMGEEGIEIAAPGSCKSGRCGVRCAPGTVTQEEREEELLPDDEASRRKDTV